MERSARKLIRRLKAEGWVHVRTKGSHMMFKHPEKGFTIVPNHSGDLTASVARSIAKAAGWRK